METKPRKDASGKGADAKAAGKVSENDPNMTTAINLPTSTWELLRRVAFQRAMKSGGRASVSAVLVALVERQRKELEKELG